MPSVDRSRGRARLGLDHVRVLGACLAGVPVAPELDGVHAGLVDAGLLGADGLPVLRLRPLLEVLAGAELLVDVETAALGVWVAHGVWATGDRAVVATGWPDEGEREYMLVELAMLPWAVAMLVGLSRRLVPDGLPATELRVPFRLVDGAMRALASLPAASGEHARQTAQAVVDRERRLPAAKRRALARLLASYQASWRITVRTPDGQVRQLVVLDAGGAGYWRRDQPASTPAPDTPVVLARRAAAEIWEEMIAVLGTAGQASNGVR